MAAGMRYCRNNCPTESDANIISTLVKQDTVTVPAMVAKNDPISIPISLKNRSCSMRNSSGEIVTPEALRIKNQIEQAVIISARRTQNTDVRIFVFRIDADDTGSVCVRYPWLEYIVL